MKDHYSNKVEVGDVVMFYGFDDRRVCDKINERFGVVEEVFEENNAVMIRYSKEDSTTRFSQSISKLSNERAMLWKLENA